MKKILNWFSTTDVDHKVSKTPQEIEMKRCQAVVNFIHSGHPLYDNILSAEKNQLHILAPNESAYNENSLIHKFVAIVIYKDLSFLVINSFKHFKEQSIGGLLQYDENIYTIVPFFEDDEEYKTSSEYTFKETYEYDHPVEVYTFMATDNNKTNKITLNRGKTPINLQMIDEKRELFTEKLSKKQINMIDYIILPAVSAYNKVQEQRKNKVS